jgi:cytochrome c-type biogenesis protein CcmE
LTPDWAVDTLPRESEEDPVFMSKGVQIAGGATLIVLLLLWYAISNPEAGSSFTYYQTLADFQATAASNIGEYARIRGFVTTGSIERDLAAKQVRFRLQDHPSQTSGEIGTPLPVVYADLAIPDLFKGGAEVVIEGRLASAEGEVYFHASKVITKCSSKYKAEPTQPAPV